MGKGNFNHVCTYNMLCIAECNSSLGALGSGSLGEEVVMLCVFID